MAKQIIPNITLKSFNCPHCGAHAHQTWYKVSAVHTGGALPRLYGAISGDSPVNLSDKKEQIMAIMSNERLDDHELIKRIFEGKICISPNAKDHYSHTAINLHLSICYTCQNVGIWRSDKLIYPPNRLGAEPNEDLPDEVKNDFNEAREIALLSPRAAAALLRLATEKLCRFICKEHIAELKTKPPTLDALIGHMVKNGLSPDIQKALDSVRVIGNECVHPGEMSEADTSDTVGKLFRLVNLVAQSQLTDKKEINLVFNGLPADKKEGINNRDKKARSQTAG